MPCSRSVGAANGAAAAGRRELECDLLVVSGPDAPATSLVSQAHGKMAYDDGLGVFKIDELPAGVWAAGQVAGEGAHDMAEASGELAGLEAAAALGLDNGKPTAGRRAELRSRLQGDEPPAVSVPPPQCGNGPGKAFACFCEDVSAKDIHRSVEGRVRLDRAGQAPSTTVTMGPCQGRMCQLSSIRLMAKETGQSLADVGSTTARPPWSTVPMGALAGRPIEPAKRSSIHARHLELGARIEWAGDWRRAYDYGDPQAEALAVQRTAGLIDVSTLGKLLVQGPDAGELLDRMYPNRISNLKPGRVRYGVLTSEAGRIMDDGTLCRLDDQTFYVTTTSSGAGAVEQWFSWWLAPTGRWTS